MSLLYSPLPLRSSRAVKRVARRRPAWRSRFVRSTVDSIARPFPAAADMPLNTTSSPSPPPILATENRKSFPDLPHAPPNHFTPAVVIAVVVIYIDTTSSHSPFGSVFTIFIRRRSLLETFQTLYAEISPFPSTTFATVSPILPLWETIQIPECLALSPLSPQTPRHFPAQPPKKGYTTCVKWGPSISWSTEWKLDGRRTQRWASLIVSVVETVLWRP